MMTSNRSLAFKRLVLATLAVLSVLAALPAAADDRDTCQAASDDVAIEGCSRAISSGNFRGQSLAQLYQWRGHQYLTKTQRDRNRDELDRAIADFTEAIGIDPETVGCFTCRCAARLVAGQLADALEDSVTVGNGTGVVGRPIWSYSASAVQRSVSAYSMPQPSVQPHVSRVVLPVPKLAVSVLAKRL